MFKCVKLLNKFPDKPWNWEKISRNPNITIEYILANPDKPWDWDSISENIFNKDLTVKKTIENRIYFRKECYNEVNTYLIADISYIIAMYL